MDTITALLTIHDGVVTGTELARAGLSVAEVRAAVHGRRLHAVRRATYVDGARWHALAEWERHDLRGRAVLHALDPGASGKFALSHHTALAAQDVAHHGTDDLVHVVRTDGGRGRRAGLLVVHEAVDAAQVTTTPAGVSVVRPALACLQVAVRYGASAGLVGADSALHRRLVTIEDLAAASRSVTSRAGRPALGATLERATGLHESAGETLSSELMRALGLPEPERQVLIRDRAGTVVARVDFLIRSRRTIVEFDGLLKYTSPEVLRKEKLREDRLRALGYEVVRLTWADLADPVRVHRLLTAAFARAAARAA